MYAEVITLLEQGIPETQVPATMPQGKAIDVRDRQFVVRLKDYFDQERHQGLSVSTQDPAGRVAKALGIGKRSVKAILSTYHHGGQIAAPALESKGNPPYRIKPALETVIRHRIRELNRHGNPISVRSLSHWLSQNYEAVPRATLGRTLQRMGVVYGKSLNKPVLRERDEVLIARRVYLRKKLANRDPQGGTVRPEVYLDESYVNVNHSPARTWSFAEDGPWVQKPSGKGLRLILVHAMTAEGWVEGAKLVFQAKRRTGDYHGQMNFENFRRWFIAVSSQGHINQSVKVRPRLKDSGLVAWEVPWRESKTVEPSDNILEIEYRQSTRLQRAVNAEVASLHATPVAETVDNARRQQGLGEMSPRRQPSPAGYQRRHGTKEDVSTGEARGARRGKLVEEASPITVSGKWRRRRPGDGSGRSTVDRCAAKRTWREGPGPVSTPLVKVRQG